jgi:hypothetical protein
MKYLMLAMVALSSIFPACAQEKRKSPHETVKNGNISVTYGRPYKKGRDVFGGLEPYGKVWRAGADEATEITFAKDGSFGGKPVKAGTYTLFATPNEKEWTLILNGQLKQWGAYDYEKNKDKDVLQVNAPVKALSNPVEQFTIRFDAGKMILEWDKTQVAVPVS